MSRMEGGDFHHQLHSLKDRVHALTMQYSPRPAHAAPRAPLSPQPIASGDVFTAQLHDIKAHVATLQTSIAKCEASMRQQAVSRALNKINNQEQLAAQSRLTLPSGPVFWQLFNSLRADFQTLDTRVAGLEQDVDALEDRVDRLEPDRFTPAGSTASQEDCGGEQVQPRLNDDLLGPSTACLPELCSQETDTVEMANTAQHHRRISSLQSQPNTAFEWQWPASNYMNEGVVTQSYAPPLHQGRGAFDTSTAYSLKPISEPVYPEGVAFRDREIDRMDDQLRAVQESLRSSEALAASKDNTVAHLQAELMRLSSDNAALAEQNTHNTLTLKKRESCIQQHKREREKHAERSAVRDEEQQKTIEAHLQTIADRDFAVRYWQERCDQEASMYRHSLADRDHALQRWEESYTAVSDAWRHENERANALASRIDLYRSDRRKEMEHVHLKYEREIDKLKEFCEHKDAIIVKQERVMSRGGGLLEERDREIDRLQRRLRVAADDMQHGERQQKRTAKLLEEHQAELERLRMSNVVPIENGDNIIAIAHEQEQAKAASAQTLDGRENVDNPGRYPRAVRDDYTSQRDRHSGTRGDSAASEREGIRIGSPQQRRLRRHDSSRHLPTHQHHHMDGGSRGAEREPTLPPRPHREDRNERLVRDNAETKPDIPDRRRARFLDDSISFNPPLPAPVAARKMASEADLRSPRNGIRGDGAQRSLAKHQSMQELPGARRRLQAYVETEGESDAERDGPGLV